MLIPQYSIRRLLALTTGCAAVSSVFGLAVRGSRWAQGVSIAIAALMVVLLIHAVFFIAVWLVSVVTGRFFRGLAGTGRSPFAHGPTALPPEGIGTAASHKEIPATPILLD
jgi:hypothetical protein